MNLDTEKQEVPLFHDLLGQSSAIAMLQSALSQNRLAPAYLFYGPDGVGRKLAALRFLEGLLNNGQPIKRERRRLENRNHPDLLWIEPTYLHQGQLIAKSRAKNESINRRTPPQIRLEQIRGIRRFLSQQPLETKGGMVIIEEVESMAEAAGNALLKTLEEPGKGILILISERPEKLLTTIKSRCQKIPFAPLDSFSIKQVFSKLKAYKELDLDLDLITLEEHDELLKISGGSPGALLRNYKAWMEIPRDLWPRLESLPHNAIDALSLARDLTESLDGEQQLWIINWLEQNLWRKEKDPIPLKRLEKLRSHLLSFVQPRLAWEVTLLELNKRPNY